MRNSYLVKLIGLFFVAHYNVLVWAINLVQLNRIVHSDYLASIVFQFPAEGMKTSKHFA